MLLWYLNEISFYLYVRVKKYYTVFHKCFILQLEMMENLKEEKNPDCIEFLTVKRKLLL